LKDPVYVYYAQYTFCHGQLISVYCYKHNSLPSADICELVYTDWLCLQNIVPAPIILFSSLKRKTSYRVAAKVLSRRIIRGLIY